MEKEIVFIRRFLRLAVFFYFTKFVTRFFKSNFVFLRAYKEAEVEVGDSRGVGRHNKPDIIAVVK